VYQESVLGITNLGNKPKQGTATTVKQINTGQVKQVNKVGQHQPIPETRNQNPQAAQKPKPTGPNQRANQPTVTIPAIQPNKAAKSHKHYKQHKSSQY
jgi:hypothetical protein